MKKSTKATLCSLLVFPGTGHLLLKNYPKALGFMGTSALALFYISKTIMGQVHIIVDKVSRGEIDPNIVNLTRIVDSTMHNTDATLLNLAQYILVGCWLVSTIDAFRMGKQMDNQP